MVAKFIDHNNRQFLQQQKSNRCRLAKEQLCTYITLFCTLLRRCCIRLVVETAGQSCLMFNLVLITFSHVHVKNIMYNTRQVHQMHNITNQLAWRNCNISNFSPGKRKTVITSNWLPSIHSHGILSSTEQAVTFRMKCNAPTMNKQSSILTFHIFGQKWDFGLYIIISAQNSAKHNSKHSSLANKRGPSD